MFPWCYVKLSRIKSEFILELECDEILDVKKFQTLGYDIEN